jgi:hypothetical protein
MPEDDQQQADNQVDDTQQSGTDDGEVDWKAKAREWEKRAKDNHRLVQQLTPKAQQFDALEAASKSDLERAQEQITALQQQAATNERQALVASVALEKGLPANLARRLQGESRDDLEADADDLLAQFPQQQSTEPRAPRVDLSQGSSSGSRVANDPAQEFASIIRSHLGS